MVKVVITAPRGTMDKLVVEEAFKDERLQIVGCIGTPGREYIGKDVGMVCAMGKAIGAQVYDDIEEVIDECDVVVDYSVTGLSMKILNSCLIHGKALLCGTTGFSDEENAAFKEASERIPLMKTANTSYVVTVMKKLLEDAGAKLGKKSTVEIIDMHSETKLDAPSGTAIELGEKVVSRDSHKTLDDIRFHSIRAGNTPSIHRVIFGCMGEKMEISHDAYDWRCYALGACDAAVFLAEVNPGSYSMEDLLK